MRRLYEITARRFMFFAFAEIWPEIGSNLTRENACGKIHSMQNHEREDEEEATSIIYVAKK